MMVLQMARPIPKLPGLVVKNGSKTWLMVFGLIPAPASATATTRLSELSTLERMASARNSFATVSIASAPLLMRFRITCCSWAWSVDSLGARSCQSTHPLGASRGGELLAHVPGFVFGAAAGGDIDHESAQHFGRAAFGTDIDDVMDPDRAAVGRSHPVFKVIVG